MSGGPAQGAIEEAVYRWTQFETATTPTEQAARLVELANAMHDLGTWVTGWDYETGTHQWQREEEVES